MKRYAVLGEHLPHTISPAIHCAIFELMGIAGDYRVLEVARDEAPRIRERLLADGYAGVNVTIPYKETVIPQLDALSDEAREIGAVNTISIENGRLTGYNTDYYGLEALFARVGITLRGGRAAVLGTGGAAKAACAYLKSAGVETLFTVSRTAQGAPIPGAARISYEELAAMSGDVIVNATPVGMFPHTGVSPVPEAVIRRFGAAVDLIYNPAETEFLRLAAANGLKTANGLTMLLMQAVRAEEIWQRRAMPEDARAELLHRLKEQNGET